MLIGVLVMIAVLIGLEHLFGQRTDANRRAPAVFSACCGILTTLFLKENPALTADISARVVLAALAILLALLALVRKGLS